MEENYSKLFDILAKMGFLPETGYGSINIIVKDFKITECERTTHWLNKAKEEAVRTAD